MMQTFPGASALLTATSGGTGPSLVDGGSPSNTQRRRQMFTYLKTLRQHISNERGAEIAEWVIWVGGVAILAGVVFSAVSGSLSGAVTNILGSIAMFGS